MGDGKKNPYEVLDLDPGLDLRELTQLLRERAELLPPEERAPIQGLWQALTLDPEERLRHALLAQPKASGFTELEVLLEHRLDLPPLDISPETLLNCLEVDELLVLPSLEVLPSEDDPKGKKV